MAFNQKKDNTTAPLKNKFAETIHLIARRYSLFTAFDDFLTMSIAACTQNLHTKKSWYEEDYLKTIDKYKDSELRHEFSKAFAYLIMEMEEKYASSLGDDVLGDFYESIFQMEGMGSTLLMIQYASSWRQLLIVKK